MGMTASASRECNTEFGGCGHLSSEHVAGDAGRCINGYCSCGFFHINPVTGA